MKTSLRFLLFTLACSGAARAENMEELPLRPPVESRAPQQTEEVIYRFNNYDDRGFNRVVQKVSVPTLTVYHPAGATQPTPAIVVSPGGGYQYIAIDREGFQMGRYFSARGFTVAVLKYRLPDPANTKDDLPLPQQDVLAAVKFVRDHAAEWHVDPKRVGVMGFSAGGHLAGSAAMFGDAAAGTRPDFAALIYPVVCMDGPYVHQGSRKNLLGASPSAERVAEFSLEKRARAGLPPFFLVHARDDKGVPPQNTELLAAALEKEHVPVETLFVATGGHGFGVGRDAESARWKDAFVSWFNKLP